VRAEATVRQSQCCYVCGPEEYRTIDIGGQTYETIPSKILIQAGLQLLLNYCKLKTKNPAAPIKIMQFCFSHTLVYLPSLHINSRLTPDGKDKVLFLCINNSARSQIIEGLLRHYYGEKDEAFIAGATPTKVHPLAIKAMAEIGIDISGQSSKSIDEFRGKDLY
jgi:hypothetical protein